MKKVKIVSPSKINFTLDVLGIENGYHNIKSLVSSISLADKITVKLNKLNCVRLFEKGFDCGCLPQNNNAVKTAEKYLEKLKEQHKDGYSNLGVDISVIKKIPIASGLGGSSADIVGVLKGLDKLFCGAVDIVELANQLGSDCAYMLKGGYACISGRGEKVQSITSKLKLYIIILWSKSGVSAKDSYNEYDKLIAEYNFASINEYSNGVQNLPTIKGVEALIANDGEGLIKILSNDLTKGSINLVSEIGKNKQLLSEFAPTVMSGSGSAVYCCFLTKKERNKAYKELKKRKIENLIKAETL